MDQASSNARLSPGHCDSFANKQDLPDLTTRDSIRCEKYDTSCNSTSSCGPDDSVVYSRWVNAVGSRMRPVDFQPTGSFKVLKESGKLIHKDGSLYPDYKGREQQQLHDKQYIPGYTGFVRGRQHISGRTYGETTRRALSAEYREVVCTSPIPSAPQANRKIDSRVLHDTFMAQFADKQYHIPGYTGFVPNARHTYAMTYGRNTAQQLTTRQAYTAPRPSQGERQHFARTSFPRKQLSIDSAPLPGGARTQKPPEMYIPTHLNYLNFFPM